MESEEEITLQNDSYVLTKQRGRDKKCHIRTGKGRTERQRTSSPAGGNSAKCCPYCCPKYVTNHINKKYYQKECNEYEK